MPNLAELLPAGHVTWLRSGDKTGALRELLELLATSRAVKDPKALEAAIYKREVLMSTGVGYGVAVPHASIPSVESFVLAMGISERGVDYRSPLDDRPVRLVVMIAAPPDSQKGYLRLLSTLMRFIKSEKGKILSSSSTEEIRRFARNYSLSFDMPQPGTGSDDTPPA